MDFFKNKEIREAYGVCYSCQSPIFDPLWRQLILKDSDGESFPLNYHYFPPCFIRGDVQIPEHCEFEREGYGANKDIFQKYPFLDKELVKLDDTMDTLRKKSHLEDYR